MGPTLQVAMSFHVVETLVAAAILLSALLLIRQSVGRFRDRRARRAVLSSTFPALLFLFLSASLMLAAEVLIMVTRVNPRVLESGQSARGLVPIINVLFGVANTLFLSATMLLVIRFIGLMQGALSAGPDSMGVQVLFVFVRARSPLAFAIAVMCSGLTVGFVSESAVGPLIVTITFIVSVCISGVVLVVGMIASTQAERLISSSSTMGARAAVFLELTRASRTVSLAIFVLGIFAVVFVQLAWAMGDPDWGSFNARPVAYRAYTLTIITMGLVVAVYCTREEYLSHAANLPRDEYMKDGAYVQEEGRNDDGAKGVRRQADARAAVSAFATDTVDESHHRSVGPALKDASFEAPGEG